MADSFLDNIDVGKLAAYLSGSAKASAAGNEAEGQYLNARDLIKSHLYGTQSTAATAANAQGLNNAKFATSLPGVGASEAVRGSLIQNSQDAGVNLGNNRANVVNFTGGTRPSSFTPETRQAGADLITHGQSLIANPGSFVPAQQSVAPPALSEEPKAGFWGKAAGAGGTIAGLLDALSKKGGPGAGGNVPLNDIINWLKGKVKGKSGDNGYGYDPNQDRGPFDDFGDDGYGYDPNQDRGPDDPVPNVSTSTEFGGIPGGFPNYPEDPNSANPNWWDDVGGGYENGGYEGEDFGEGF